MTSTRCSHWRPAYQAFLVAGRTHFNDPESIAGLHVRLLGRDVHPADVVRMTIADELRVEIVQPIGIGLAQSGPFVAGALGKPLQIDEPTIDVDAAAAGTAFEFGLAKSGDDLVYVDGLSVHGEDCIHVIEIGVFRAPETRFLQRPGGFHDALVAIGQRDRGSVELGPDSTAPIDDHGRQHHRGASARGILHLRLDRHVDALSGDVEVRAMHVDARSLQAVVQRQRLVDLAGDVQPHVPVDPAMVRVEVVGVPLEPCAGGPLAVGGPVVHLHGQYVLRVSEMDGVGDVQAVGGHAVLIESDLLAVEEDLAGLPHPLEFEEDLLAGKAGRKLEMLAVPGQPFVRAARSAIRSKPQVSDNPFGFEFIEPFTRIAQEVQVDELVIGSDFPANPLYAGRGFGHFRDRSLEKQFAPRVLRHLHERLSLVPIIQLHGFVGRENFAGHRDAGAPF